MESDIEGTEWPQAGASVHAAVTSHGEIPLVQAKLVDALHELQRLPPAAVTDHERAVRAVQEALTIVGDSDDSETLGPVDWGKFAGRLLQRRLAAGLTQEVLAEMIGVTATTIRGLERNRRKASRGVMLKLLSVPQLNLRVSDIELSAELTAGARWTPTSWLDSTYDPVGMITSLAETLNGASGQLEQTFVYLDLQSAKDWMATCSSADYQAALCALVPIEAMARRIAELVGNQALSVTALGCGDGRTEAALLRDLQRLLPSASKTELFLLDISHALLNAAYRHTAEVLPNLKTYTIHGNFHDLPRLPMLVAPLRGRRRLHAMLGATLANLNDEVRYFRDTLSCCASGDLFLFDVRIAPAPASDREKILRQDPICIGNGKVRPSHLTWLTGPIRRYCNGADEIKLRWELAPPGGVAGSYGFDAIATVKMRDGQPDRRFLMFRLRRYDPKLLSTCLTDIGWDTVERIDYGPDGKKTMSLLLLQKR